MCKKTNDQTVDAEGKQYTVPIDVSAVMQKATELLNAIELLKSKNPGVDVNAILAAQSELYPALKLLSNREVDRFVAYAKEQGTKMPFHQMEMGMLAAGRKDMQNGLAEVANSLKFPVPSCEECYDGMDNRGRSKKKS